MDRLRQLLVELKRDDFAKGNFLGMLNVLIGSTIETTEGQLVSTGATWRALADQLKKVRWTKDAAADLGLKLDEFAPRDRQKFWYQVIAHVGVDTPKAREAGAQMIEQLKPMGYRIKASGAAEQSSPSQG